MIKLIAIDMDGTLLNDDKTISENTYDVLEKLVEKGMIICAISGRTLNNVKHAFTKPLNNLVYVGDNGAQIELPDHALLITKLDTQIVEKVVKIAKDNKIYISLNGVKHTYILNSKDKTYRDVLNTYGIHPVEIDNLDAIDDTIVKITVYEPRGSSEFALSYFQNIEHAQVIVSGDLWLDITGFDCSKGIALEKVLNHFNIKIEECYVFGDHINDLSMFKYAKYTYAVNNAHSKLKDSAYEVLPQTNNEEAIYHKIKELL